jgi:hypothetical protein
MAPRSKTAPVGSSQWIQTEREQAAEFVDMEVEEFGYAAQNEMEWLNEHMAEIFSTNPVYAASVPFLRMLALTFAQKFCRHLQDSWKATRQDSSYSAQERCPCRTSL